MSPADLRWKRPESSFHDSHCGRFSIVPIYRSTVKPDGYKLKDKLTKKEHWVDTVRDAKQRALEIVVKESLDQRKAVHQTGRGADVIALLKSKIIPNYSD